MSALPPAGWYTNPESPSQQRWWDGQQWTSHVAAGQHITVNVNSPAGSQPGRQPARQPAAGVDPSRLATAGQRLGAWAIDVGVVWGAVIAASLIGGLFGSEGLSALVLLAVFIAAFTYSLLYPARYGQTLGKHLLGIQLLRLDDGATAIGGAAAFGREFIKGLGAYVFGLGLLWILFDRDRQGWHDKAVRTVVVRTDQPKLSVGDFLAAPFRN